MLDNNNAAPRTCQICQGAMTQRVAPWTSYCPACDYWAAGLKYDIESENDEIFEVEDESAISFLDRLRVQNFNKLLERAERLIPGRSLSILDVGCAAGLFLHVARMRGHSVLGLEPNPKMAAAGKRKGLNVVQGYFPDASPEGHRFDLITFNDVFEHIPQLDGILAAARERLQPDGLLALSLPSSEGLLFRMGQVAYRLGVTKLWHRLWQTMFYTPHLHYFSARSLDKLVGRFGFAPGAKAMELPIMSISGLWGRVQADKTAPLPKRVLIYFAALGVYPVLRYFPQDAFVAFYRPT
jgi:SAM-dependent methyltransferase